MSSLEIWLVIIGLTIVTILMRSSFLMLGDYFPLPERVQHGLRYAPVCALVALITPELFLTPAGFDLSISNPKLAAGLAAAIIAVTTRSMIAAMALGMLVFTLLRLLPAST
ncbi:MAG TPA: AzlD domain-containing protein [Burkholderiaceae bacterium]|nr:AzlD domain-containing protein [Burkholderiaceae bacterium]